MKKLLLVILSFCLIVGMCACGNKGDEAPSDTVGSSTAETTKADDGEDKIDVTDANLKTFALNSPSLSVRFFGEREQKEDLYVSCNYPGSGFECKIKCYGDSVSLKAATTGKCVFMVYVDGKLQKTAEGKSYFIVMGDRLITVDGLSAGEHTLKVIRATDFGVDAKLYSLVFNGEMLEADGADEKRTFVEFIGDGLNSTVGGAAFLNNVSVTYPYLIASSLDVDYSITAYNGCGLTCTERTVSAMYGGEGSGSFERKADVAVINVGALDVLTTGSNTVSVDKFKSAYTELIKKVKEINGSSCKIILVCTNGNADFRNAVKDICSSLGGESNGYYLLMLPVSATVPPSVSDHKAYAEAVAKCIEEAKNYELKPITAGESGTGNFIAIDSDKWEVM